MGRKCMKQKRKETSEEGKPRM